MSNKVKPITMKPSAMFLIVSIGILTAVVFTAYIYFEIPLDKALSIFWPFWFVSLIVERIIAKRKALNQPLEADD